jgi:acyl-CoA dehydrogenase
MEVAAWSVGAAQRALDMMCEYAPQRSTFGRKLSDRQTIQWWAVDASAMIRATRLMAYECAWKLDQGHDVRNEISTLKFFGTEMAQQVIDNAMQCFGAMGMTKELPLYMLAEKIRVMRILDGPSEVHRMVVARSLMDTRG